MKEKEKKVIKSDKQKLTHLTQNLISAEINLELIGFFSPSCAGKQRPTTVKTISYSYKNNEHQIKKEISIIPLVNLGRPITRDLDIYRAFFKILKTIYYKKGKIENPVVFKNIELVKAAGLPKGGRLNQEIKDWLIRMKGTVIKGTIYFKNEDKYVDTGQIGISLFDKVINYGQTKSDGKKAMENYVWLSDWFLNNINSGYIFLLDHEIYKKLKYPISKCLYGLLWWGFYAVNQNGQEFYRKDYGELCRFLDIKEYKYESKIKEKLSLSHNELINVGLISKWELEKNSKGTGWNLKWWHGEMFESYYWEIKNRKDQLSLDEILNNTIITENKSLIEKSKEPEINGFAQELIKYFHEKIKGNSKYKPRKNEIEFANTLVNKYDKKQIWHIVKFSIDRIHATNFNAQNFGAIKCFVEDAINAYISEQKLKQCEQEQKRKKFDILVTEYQKWLHQTPEERVKPFVDMYITKIRTFEKKEPSQEDIARKTKELIEQEPTPEEKQHILFGDILFDKQGNIRLEKNENQSKSTTHRR